MAITHPKSLSSSATVLVVSDNAENNARIGKPLAAEGYQVVAAYSENLGELLSIHTPEFVLVSANITNAKLVSKLKTALNPGHIQSTPVFAVGEALSKKQIEKLMQMGLDDVISLPFNAKLLVAKIPVYRNLFSMQIKLQELTRESQQQSQVAQHIYQHNILSKNPNLHFIDTWFHNIEKSNQDIYLVEHTPGSGINILFGHFNTEGLAASVAAIPIAEVFRAMTKKGFAASEILNGINKKLCDLLPNYIEFSSCLINLDSETKSLNICNLSMPDIYITSEEDMITCTQIKSIDVALGGNPSLKTESYFSQTSFTDTSQIIIVNRKLLTSENEQAIPFGQERLRQAILSGIKQKNVSGAIQEALNKFSGLNFNNVSPGAIVISGKEFFSVNNRAIPPSKQNVTPFARPSKSAIVEDENASINFELTISGKNLQSVDPIPILINYMQSVAKIENGGEALFTVLTELYVNALDHGVLGLDSKLKHSADGFSNYFEVKKQKLNQLEKGHVGIKLRLANANDQYRLLITVSDSGSGFDYQALNKKFNDGNAYSGRGILLLTHLCESIEFHDPGNIATAIFNWRTGAN